METAPDVFYFGNLIGDTGDNPTSLRVNAMDLGAVKRLLNTDATVTSDGRINSLDLGIIKTNLNRSLPALVPPSPLMPDFSRGQLVRTRISEELLR